MKKVDDNDEYECRINFLQKHLKLSDFKYDRKEFLNIINKKKLLINNYNSYSCLESMWRDDFFKIGKNFIKKELIDTTILFSNKSYYLDQINFYRAEKIHLLKAKKEITNKIKNNKVNFVTTWIKFVQERIIINILIILFFVFFSIQIFYFSFRFNISEINK